MSRAEAIASLVGLVLVPAAIVAAAWYWVLGPVWRLATCIINGQFRFHNRKQVRCPQCGCALFYGYNCGSTRLRNCGVCNHVQFDG